MPHGVAVPNLFYLSNKSAYQQTNPDVKRTVARGEKNGGQKINRGINTE